MKKKSEENSGSSRRTSTEGSIGRKKFSGEFEPPTQSDRAPRREFTGSGDRPARPSRSSYGDRPDRPARPSRSSYGDRPDRPARSSSGDRPDRPARPSRRSYGDRPDRPSRPSYGDRPDRPARPARSFSGDRPSRPTNGDRPVPKSQRIDRLKKNLEDMDRTPGLDLAAEWNELQLQNLTQDFGPEPESEPIAKTRPRTKPKAGKSGDSLVWPMRVNRYVSLSGLCSRRTADELISAGRITINEQVADVLGTKVNEDDVVRYDGEILTLRRYVYVLLNKPKDYITTMDDPENRRTVMELVEDATSERIVPAGRLDRNTTGLLLLTNDGDLIQKLTHPSSEIPKIYAVELDKPLSQNHFSQVLEGLPLEDGLARVDALAWPEPRDKKLVGLSLHSGKNRIVRRIFEHLGYEVQRLDRVSYAGLTKKDLPRGHWRYLSEKEVRFLKAGKKVF